MLQGASVTAARPVWLEDWASFAATITPADLPETALARTRLVLLDCIGAIAAGSCEPEMQRLAARMCRHGTGPVPVIGTGLAAAPGTAAFLNGTAGTMLEIDEGNQYARGHPGIHVVPAALAMAQEVRATADELLLAIALGYEIGARIGIASKLRVTMHPHGTWGTVGAALTAARLARAPAAAMAEVINVSSTLGLATSRRTMLEGGTVRNSFAGISNELGLRAWEMVDCGFVGEADGVGTVYGTVIADQFQPDEMVADLGTRWEIARNYFKRHAACRYNHAALDALAVLMVEHDLVPDAIERIEVETYVWAAQLDSPEPRNMLAAKFSLPFSVATTIVNGAATVEAFRDAARADDAIRALARRVTVREDPALTAMLPGLRPARLRITLRDGRTLAGETLTNRGDTEDPYSREEIIGKFHEVASPVWDEARREQIVAAVEGLAGAGPVTGLMGLLSTTQGGDHA